MRSFGVDLARTGEDKTVLCVADIEGNRYRVYDLEVWAKADLMESSGRIERLYRRWKPDRLVIDCDGLGAGCFDRLREQDLPVVAFHGAARTDRRDTTGELGFINLRSYAWWNARTILDPGNGFEVILPRDDDLIGDLCSPRWNVVSGSRIRVESKDDVRKRLRRSPDRGDSFIYAICDIDRSAYEDSYRVMSQHEVEQTMAGPRRQTEPSPEETMNQLLWGGARQNHDVFGDW